MTCTWAASPRCMLRGLRAHQGVNVHVQGFVCERHTPRDTLVPKTQTTSPTTARFHRILPRWSALWAPHRLTSRPHHRQSEGIALHEGHHSPLVRASRPPNGGIGIIRGVTRRRHADSQLLMLQTPTATAHGTPPNHNKQSFGYLPPHSGWRAGTTPTTPTALSATTIQCTAGERCTS